MQKYQSHKVVEAAKIEKFGAVPGGAHLTLKQSNPNVLDVQHVDHRWLEKHTTGLRSIVGGYFVRYPDGYTSWSPAEAFEEGYTPYDPNAVKGLPVAGYKPTQSLGAVTTVSLFKADEERILRKLDELASAPPEECDKRWLAIGRTDLERAFMAINRSIFQPGRVTLPEDEPQTFNGVELKEEPEPGARERQAREGMIAYFTAMLGGAPMENMPQPVPKGIEYVGVDLLIGDAENMGVPWRVLSIHFARKAPGIPIYGACWWIRDLGDRLMINVATCDEWVILEALKEGAAKV